MTSGHYTSYVLSDRVRFKAAAKKATETGSGDAQVEDLLTQDKQRDLRRGWVFCSDDCVRAATWEEVAKQKAYMLYYERML
jgi:hypothetical protein